MNPYEKLIARKRKWTPVAMEAGKLKEGTEELIQRALALRHMELPVGQFITDGLEKGVPDAARTLLEMNVDDEINHDRALGYAALAHKPASAVEEEAKRLQKAWEDHPDHVICKAMVAERSIFFVVLPILRFCGDIGLRTVSADISRDEQIHVATNSLVCRELGISHSPSLDKLRKATAAWLLEPLGTNTQDKFLDKKFWMESSDRLMYEGKAPNFSVTRSARMPAFFETSNVNLPQYA